MEIDEKLEIIKHIKLGTSEIIYYPYNHGEEPLPLRPISSWELDDCFYKALENASGKVADLVIDLRLGLIDGKRDINVSDDGYKQLTQFYDIVNFWVVYYSMKDFQEDWFSKPNYKQPDEHPKGFYAIRQMSEIHEIADFVMSASFRPKDVIKEIFKDNYGREVAYCMYYLNIPLADFKNLTRLQREYLIYADGNLHKILEGQTKEDNYVFSGKEMTMKEFLRKFR